MLVWNIFGENILNKSDKLTSDVRKFNLEFRVQKKVENSITLVCGLVTNSLNKSKNIEYQYLYWKRSQPFFKSPPV